MQLKFGAKEEHNMVIVMAKFGAKKEDKMFMLRPS